jgi:hypothetical protein
MSVGRLTPERHINDYFKYSLTSLISKRLEILKNVKLSWEKYGSQSLPLKVIKQPDEKSRSAESHKTE